MLKEYLNESLTSKVYRMEPFRNFCNTIIDNKFYTSLAYGIPTEYDLIKNKKSYYLSFMRTRSNYFSGETSIMTFAMMTIDGQKFNHNFKTIPVDYWGCGPEKSESEDRIITNKPYIENAMSYIKHVDFHFCNLYSNEEFPLIANILANNNISFDVYDDPKHCLFQNKKYAVSVDYSLFHQREPNRLFKAQMEREQDMAANLRFVELMLDSELFGRRTEEFLAIDRTPYQNSILSTLRDDNPNLIYERIQNVIIVSSQKKALKDDLDSLIKFLRRNKIQSADDIGRIIQDKLSINDL